MRETIPLKDLLSGVRIAAGQLAYCNQCGFCLRPNHTVEVLVTITGTTISVATTRCAACARGELHDETELPGLLARGRVGTAVDGSVWSQLILTKASVADRNER